MRPRFSKSSRTSISWRSRSSRILGLSKVSCEASGIQPWGSIPAANSSDSSSDKNPLGVLNRSAAKVSQASSDTAVEVDSGGMMWAQYPASSLCKLPSPRGKSCDSTDAAASSLTKNGLSGNLAMAETKCKRASSGLRCVRSRSQPKRSCFMICSPGLKVVNCINKFFSSSSLAAANPEVWQDFEGPYDFTKFTMPCWKMAEMGVWPSFWVQTLAHLTTGAKTLPIFPISLLDGCPVSVNAASQCFSNYFDTLSLTQELGAAIYSPWLRNKLGTWLQKFSFSVNESDGASEMESKQLQSSQQANQSIVVTRLFAKNHQPTPVAFRCSHPASANNSGVSPARRIILQSAGSFRSCWFLLEDIHTNRGVYQSTICVGSCQNTVTVNYSTWITGPK